MRMLWKFFFFALLIGTASSTGLYNRRQYRNYLRSLMYDDYSPYYNQQRSQSYLPTQNNVRLQSRIGMTSLITPNANESLIHDQQPPIRQPQAPQSQIPQVPQFPPQIMQSQVPSPTTPTEGFNGRLFRIVGSGNPQTNVIYSPISMQILLATIYLGAEGYTASELHAALQLPQVNQSQAVNIFQNALSSALSSPTAQLIMANKMYYSASLGINPQLRNYAMTYLQTDFEPTQFAMPASAAKQINSWVAAKTQNKIANIIAANSLDPRTQAILVNAIYFKAKWAKEFSITDTAKQNFQNADQRIVPVNMMFNYDTFRYTEIPDLNAKVIELPYKDTDISMMIILPNDANGLPAVEQRIGQMDLRNIAATLRPETVTVRMPKFTIEFEVDMIQPLQRLGVTQIFTQNAQLGGFFANQPVVVSKVLHKAFIDVNEAGSEAAAVSYAKLIPLSLPPKPNYFTANHPFMFAIRGPHAVYFIGHVVNFQ